MASVVHLPHGVADEEEDCACRGVVLYPDECARNRAFQLIGRIGKRFNNLIAFDFRWWNFRFLSDSKLMGQALLEASQASIIFLSYHSCLPLPDEVKVFYELWVDQRKKGPCALVAMGESPHSEDSIDSFVVNYLQQIADRAQADLISRARLEWQSELAQISCRANHVTPTLEAILHQTPSLMSPAPLP